MIVRLNTALRNAILSAVWRGGASLSMLNGGTGEVRTGAQPASADNAATGTLLATVAVSAVAFADPAGGSISKSAAAWQDVSVDLAGQAGWVRWKSVDGLLWMDMDITNADGVGAVKFAAIDLIPGVPLIITAATLTMPGTTV